MRLVYREKMHTILSKSHIPKDLVLLHTTVVLEEIVLKKLDQQTEMKTHKKTALLVKNIKMQIIQRSFLSEIYCIGKYVYFNSKHFYGASFLLG